MSIIEIFFVKLGGADIPTLEKCPSEKSKFVSIGLTILFTGIFAALSGGYAMHKVFHPAEDVQGVYVAIDSTLTNGEAESDRQLVVDNTRGSTTEESSHSSLFDGLPLDSIVLGLLWGMMIMNIDRYIVMSMKKRGNYWKELLTATPRIILAVFISLIVAKPLEIRIFEDRISRVIDTKELTERKSDLSRLDSAYGQSLYKRQFDNFTGDVDSLDNIKNNPPIGGTYNNLITQKSAIETQIEEEEGKRILYQKDISEFFSRYTYSDTINGVVTTLPATRKKHLPSGAWSRIVNKVLQRDRSVNRLNKLNTDLESVQSNIDAILSEHNKKYDDLIQGVSVQQREALENLNAANSAVKSEKSKLNRTNAKAFSENFVTQIEALGSLTKYKKGENEDNTMYYMNLAIVLLFIVIETAPIFVKIISGKGPYDLQVEANEHAHEANSKYTANSIVVEAEQQSQLLAYASQKNRETKEKILDQTLNEWKAGKIKELKNGNFSDEEFHSFVKKFISFKLSTQVNTTVKSHGSIFKRFFFRGKQHSIS